MRWTPVALVPFALAPLAQEERALFDASVLVLDYATAHTLVRTPDLNGDGLPDFLGKQYFLHDPSRIQLRAHLNEGDGAPKGFGIWSLDHPDDDASIQNPLEVGDLNGDGKDDVILAVGERVMTWISNGAGLVPQTPILLGAEKAEALAVGDLDLDGLDDIAVITDQKVRVAFSAVPWNAGVDTAEGPVSATSEFSGLAMVDLGGDDPLELLALTSKKLYRFDRVGSALNASGEWTHGLNVPHLTVGDVDGDGDGDAALFSEFPQEYRILKQDGGSVSLQAVGAGGPATDLVDIDGDGDLDGACCGGGGGPTYFNAPSWYRISINDGTGRFAPSFAIEGLGGIRLAGAKDMDGDGDVDLVGGRTVYYGTGDGLGDNPFPLLDDFWITEEDHLDVDRDGDLDVGLSLEGGWRRHLGNGVHEDVDTVFDPPPAGHTYGKDYAGDWDGDGDPDLIVELFDATDTFVEMRLLVNNGGGVFTFGPSAAAPGQRFDDVFWTLGHLPADADGDGDVDVFLLHWNDRTSDLWLNDGTGSFTFEAHLGEYVKDVVDFDEDGLPDLLVAYTGLGYRLGTGAGDFAPVSWFFNAQDVDHHHSLQAVADLDHDGDVDILAYDDEVDPVVFKNNGDGTFAAVKDLLPPLTGSTAAKAHATDVNGDGKNDLVVYPVGSNVSGIYEWVGPGLTWSSTPYFQIFRPHSMADVDSDGDEDVFVAHLVRSRQFEGPADGLVRQWGKATTGSGATAPTLGARGPVRLGASPELRLAGALGNSIAFLAVGAASESLSAFPVPSTTTYVDPFTAPFAVVQIGVPGPAGQPGEGLRVIPITVDPSLVGQPWYHQAFVLDPGAADFLAASNGLELHYGG